MNTVAIDRSGSANVVTVSGCATCGVDLPCNDAPGFTIELPDGEIHFHLCPACVLVYGSPKAGERFREALLARLAKVTEHTVAAERRAALHQEEGHA